MKHTLVAFLVTAFAFATGADPPASQPAKLPKVVFVIDGSGSMMKCSDLVHTAMQRRIASLKNGQEFNVLVYQDEKVLGLQKPLLVFNDKTQADILKFIDGWAARGPGDPIMALQVAVGLRPDVIYWISDGVVNDEASAAALFDKIKAVNSRKIKIEATLYEAEDTFGAALMSKVAAEFSGTCVDGEGKVVTPRPPPVEPKPERIFPREILEGTKK